MKALFIILLVLDAIMVVGLIWSMAQPTFKPGESRLILLFAGLLGLAWYIRPRYPKTALLLVSIPLLSPVLVWVFLAVVFILFSATK